jgi:hypothetical protein
MTPAKGKRKVLDKMCEMHTLNCATGILRYFRK